MKPPILLAALMIGGTALAPSAVAINPSSQIQSAESNRLESRELVAGRGILAEIFRPRPRTRFERFYRRNCRYRYSLEECYRLYEYKVGGRRFRRRRRRVFDRYEDRFHDRFERRRHRGGDDDD